MLGRMICCTLVVERFLETLDAWQRWFDYRLLARGYVSAEQARLWGAEAMAGRSSAVLAARSGGPGYLRLVQGAAPAGYQRLRSWGWNAVEILVEDPYALAATLGPSPFRVVIPPRPIPYDPRIHAMQVVGPGEELLYMTQLPQAGAPFGLGPAQCPVDRAFIAILGGASLEAMLEHYRAGFGNEVVPGKPTVVRIVNEAFGLAADHAIGLGVVRLAPGYVLELDELPPQATPRPRRPGELPAGFAMVTFEVAAAEWPKDGWRVPPAALFEVPYDGGRVGVTEGAAGEWIELLERR